MRAEILSIENGIVVIKVNQKYLQTIDDCGKDVDISIDKHREKRSNNANAYMWTLCDKIAETILSTREDVYKQAIRDVGLFKDFSGMDESLKKAWGFIGIGFFTEDIDDTNTRCYYGSSYYNTKQMSRLVDYIVEEARELEIETATPSELERMKEQWQPKSLS